MSSDARAARRIELTLHRPWFALYAGIKPTLVIGERGQPAQWGIGTWQEPPPREEAIAGAGQVPAAGGRIRGVDASGVIALMVAIPLAGLAVVAIGFFVFGRWARSLRRRGKLHYSARTTHGSDFSSSSSVM